MVAGCEAEEATMNTMAACEGRRIAFRAASFEPLGCRRCAGCVGTVLHPGWDLGRHSQYGAAPRSVGRTHGSWLVQRSMQSVARLSLLSLPRVS